MAVGPQGVRVAFPDGWMSRKVSGCSTRSPVPASPPGLGVFNLPPRHSGRTRCLWVGEWGVSLVVPETSARLCSHKRHSGATSTHLVSPLISACKSGVVASLDPFAHAMPSAKPLPTNRGWQQIRRRQSRQLATKFGECLTCKGFGARGSVVRGGGQWVSRWAGCRLYFALQQQDQHTYDAYV